MLYLMEIFGADKHFSLRSSAQLPFPDAFWRKHKQNAKSTLPILLNTEANRTTSGVAMADSTLDVIQGTI